MTRAAYRMLVRSGLAVFMVPLLHAQDERVLSVGGWGASDFNFAISYRPARHEDRFMKAWIDLAGEGYAKSPQARGIFDRLTSRDTKGKCSKCHSVEEVAGKARKVNWKARAGSGAASLTRFNHQPHMLLVDTERKVWDPVDTPDARGCITCHQLKPDQGKAYVESFIKDGAHQVDPSQFTSNFTPMQKKFCASCHHAQAAGDGCLLCHRYHAQHPIGSEAPVPAPVSAAAQAIRAAEK